jgi:hypothetical protein
VNIIVTLFLNFIQLFYFKLIVTDKGAERNAAKNTTPARPIKFYIILLSSRLFYKNINIKIYKAITLPFVLYEYETWSVKIMGII